MHEDLIELITSDDASVGLRERRESDNNFIFDSWIRSHFPAAANKHMAWSEYQPYQKHIVTRLLERADILILCPPDDLDHIHGYICFEQFIEFTALHWMFIKYPYRKFGLGRWLVQYLIKHSNGRELLMSHICASDFWKYLRETHGFVYDPLAKEDHYG